MGIILMFWDELSTTSQCQTIGCTQDRSGHSKINYRVWRAVKEHHWEKHQGSRPWVGWSTREKYTIRNTQYIKMKTKINILLHRQEQANHIPIHGLTYPWRRPRIPERYFHLPNSEFFEFQNQKNPNETVFTNSQTNISILLNSQTIFRLFPNPIRLFSFRN